MKTCELLTAERGIAQAVTQILYVITRLEEAGMTLLTIPMSGYSTTMRTAWPETIQNAFEAFNPDDPLPIVDPLRRRARPDSARISRMDEAFRWLGFVPADRIVIRQIVGARCLVDPVSERHIFSWRRLANKFQIDRGMVQRRHAEGIDLIVSRLHRENFNFPT
jgi:hypothetical protein